MNASAQITETRMVSGFNRVLLTAQHTNELIITQGDREGLTIEGPANIVPRPVAEVGHGTLVIDTGGGWLDKLSDALTTSLTRPHIRYLLAVTIRGPGQVCCYGTPRVTQSIAPLGSLVPLGGRYQLSGLPEGFQRSTT
jgi:hypothetical protein